MSNSQEVFESHMKAVNTLNPSVVMKDYDRDAIFVTPEQTYRGSREILGFYKEFLPKFEGFEFKTIKQETNGSIVYFVWNGQNIHINVQLAADTYIIENGKIKQHTFAGIIN